MVIMKGFIVFEIKENIYFILDFSSENEWIQDGLFYLFVKGKMNLVFILVIILNFCFILIILDGVIFFVGCGIIIIIYSFFYGI